MNFIDCWKVCARDLCIFIVCYLLPSAIVCNILIAMFLPKHGPVYFLPYFIALVLAVAIITVKSADHCKKIVALVESENVYVLEILAKKDRNLLKNLFLDKKTVYECYDSKRSKKFDVYTDLASGLQIKVGDTLVFIDDLYGSDTPRYFPLHWVNALSGNKKIKTSNLLKKSKNRYLSSYSRAMEVK